MPRSDARRGSGAALRLGGCVLGLGALGLLVAAPAAARDWVRVRADDLEVLSDAGLAPAQEAAERITRLGRALRHLFPAREPGPRPLTLILFGQRARFEDFVPSRHHRPDRVEGFFQGGDERDFAALHFEARRSRPFEAVEHEYAHLALNASLPVQPVWVAEGLAELLSDGVLDAGEMRLGASRPEYEALLDREPRIPLTTLLRIGHDSPEYLEGESDRLYAGSWALARWAVHGSGLGGLRAFLDAVASGRRAEAAFEEHLGALAAAEAALGRLAPDPVLQAPAPGPTGTGPASDVPPVADVEQRLGDLLLQGGRAKRARTHLERALASDPDHVATRTSLAQLLTREGDWDGAHRELARALEAAPADPVAVLRRARLRVQEGLARGEPLPPEVEDRLVADLEEVARTAPRLHEAALLLTRLRPKPYAARIALLQPLFDQQPDRVALAQALSHLHVKNRDLAAARRVLERARDVTAEPAYRFLFDHLLARIGGFEAETAEIRGRLVNLECLSDGTLRFTVVGASSTLWLEAASTRSFFIDAAADEGERRQLVCGSQDVPLEVRYRRVGGVTDPRVAGQVVWVSFEAPAREGRRP